jgi:hypothetical protein
MHTEICDGEISSKAVTWEVTLRYTFEESFMDVGGGWQLAKEHVQWRASLVQCWTFGFHYQEVVICNARQFYLNSDPHLYLEDQPEKNTEQNYTYCT